jgi:hypothetical protein
LTAGDRTIDCMVDPADFATPLLERDAELARFGALLDQARCPESLKTLQAVSLAGAESEACPGGLV